MLFYPKKHKETDRTPVIGFFFGGAGHGFFNPGRFTDKDGVSSLDRTLAESVKFLKKHKLLK